MELYKIIIIHFNSEQFFFNAYMNVRERHGRMGGSWQRQVCQQLYMILVLDKNGSQSKLNQSHIVNKNFYQDYVMHRPKTFLSKKLGELNGYAFITMVVE